MNQRTSTECLQNVQCLCRWFEVSVSMRYACMWCARARCIRGPDSGGTSHDTARFGAPLPMRSPPHGASRSQIQDDANLQEGDAVAILLQHRADLLGRYGRLPVRLLAVTKRGEQQDCHMCRNVRKLVDRVIEGLLPSTVVYLRPSM
jgi:hypothetical protein